jgi:hypothetical protein
MAYHIFFYKLQNKRNPNVSLRLIIISTTCPDAVLCEQFSDLSSIHTNTSLWLEHVKIPK